MRTARLARDLLDVRHGASFEAAAAKALARIAVVVANECCETSVVIVDVLAP